MPSFLPQGRRFAFMWALSVLLVLLLMSATLPGASANAATLSFTPTFSPSQFLGEGSALDAQFTFTGSEYHGSPDPVTEVVVHLPVWGWRDEFRFSDV